MVRLRSKPITFASSTLPLRRRKPRTTRNTAQLSTVAPVHRWKVTKAPDRCLRLSHTLPIGQAFRWSDCGIRNHEQAFQGLVREWAGAIEDCLVVLRQAEEEPPDHMDDPVWYRFVVGDGDGVVEDYLRLKHDLSPIMKTFCEKDQRFAEVFPFLRGVRVISQEPAECLFAFICSANNNLKRITSMVCWLGKRYGTKLGLHDGNVYYEFPKVAVLAREADEASLRKAGFGYRAKYIVETAKKLHKMAENEGVSAEEMLLGWRNLEMNDVSQRLVQFPGIGRKVASCISLFSMGQFGEVPVDTHIWQIATRYLPDLKQKSLTDRVYNQVGNFFRDRFNDRYAGLAQTILFVGELPEFKKILPGYVKPAKRKRKIAKNESNIIKEEADFITTSESLVSMADAGKNEDIAVNSEAVLVKYEDVFVKDEKVLVKDEDILDDHRSQKRRKTG